MFEIQHTSYTLHTPPTHLVYLMVFTPEANVEFAIFLMSAAEL